MGRAPQWASAGDGHRAMDRREFLARMGTVALAVSAGAGLSGGCAPRLAGTGAAVAGRRLPNLLVIFTDDQGYQDAGCFGSPDIATPSLDRMAAEGMKFTDFYVAAPVCTPSRAALLTGCYPKRVGLEKGVLFPNSTTGLNLAEITIAELLKPQGYATACIGKWHLGHLPQFLPTRQGFDYYYGIPYSNDMPTPTKDGRKGCVLLRNEEVIEHPTDQSTLTERYTAEAIRFITASAGKDRPFFVYLAHNMPHVPLHISERFKGKSKRGLYGDVIECIDWGVGQILDALGRLGLDERTLVIFTSDNGPWLVKGKDGGAALPLRDGKGTTYEGGMREPCIMRWTGHIPAGGTCSEMATTMDILPTFAGLAGTGPPADRVIDGKDIWPLVSGRSGAKTPHEAFFYHTSGGQLAAVRSGRWKLHLRVPAPPAQSRPATRRGSALAPATAATSAATKPRPPAIELYDLEADIGERKNLAARHPDVVQRLRAMMERFEKDLARTARPVGRATTRPATTGGKG